MKLINEIMWERLQGKMSAIYCKIFDYMYEIWDIMKVWLVAQFGEKLWKCYFGTLIEIVK